MAEYIERDAVIALFDSTKWQGTVAIMAVEDLPAADVAPVVHGQWKLENTMDCSEDKLYCSECKYVAWVGRESYKGRTPFCPNCGAKMGDYQ